MVFFGTIPTPCIQQVLSTNPFESWGSVYLCCSGSFKIEQALRQRHPELPLFSNDVSLWSCAIGKLAAGQSVDVKFTGELEFVEAFLGPNATSLDRVAAVAVVQDMSRFVGAGEYLNRHYRYHVQNFATLHSGAKIKVDILCGKLKLDGFFAGDWRTHVDAAIEQGAGIVSFPPFFKGGYEKLYKFLDANTEWDAPEYDIYNPHDLGDIVDRVDDSGAPYCIITEQVLEGRKPTTIYEHGRRPPHYSYSRSTMTSARRTGVKLAKQFAYKQIDFSKVRKKSVCQVIEADTESLNFIKDVHLAKGITHVPGMANYLVYIDDMLAGGIIYARGKYGCKGLAARECLYLLSDVALKAEGRLSKLVSMLAASRDVVHPMELRLIQPIRYVVTTAFSEKPVSMKYRGIYEKLSSRPADPPATGLILQYGSAIRQQSIQQVYREWFNKHHVPSKVGN